MRAIECGWRASFHDQRRFIIDGGSSSPDRIRSDDGSAISSGTQRIRYGVTRELRFSDVVEGEQTLELRRRNRNSSTIG